jgi:fructose-1-phosphate kinase PfkB-like protein
MATAPTFFTLTGNLLAERTLEFANWQPGKTQRAQHETFQVGGKGINVSKMLNRLGAPNTALCFTGGAPGAECAAWLREKGFSFQAFTTDQTTRAGTVVRGGSVQETTFLGPDVVPSADAILACASYLDQQADGNVLAVCGSLPGWDLPTFDPLRACLQRWLSRGILTVDTYGPALSWFVQQPAALVKINLMEFLTLPGTPASLTELSGSPVERWVVSDGPEAVSFRDGKTGRVETLHPPRVEEVSATGSGDVLFASLLYALFSKQRDLRSALLWAMPLAAANAAHPGIAEFPGAVEFELE